MKLRFVFALLVLFCTTSLFAQGYKDGVEYYKVNQFEKAKILLNRNLNNADTDKALAYYYLGQVAMAEGNVAEAKACFDKGIAANPENGYNYVGLGAIALKNKDVKGAENFFKTAKSKAKKDAVLLVEIARAYVAADPVAYAKQIADNIKAAKKVNKRHPAPFILEGDMLAAEKKWGDAAGYYEMAESFDPNCTEAYVKYANTYFNVDPRVAISKLESLVAANPNSALAQRELAEKLYENDEWTRAAQVYGEYIKNPNSFKEDEERYAVLLYFGEKYQQSYDLAQKILSENPKAFLMKRIVFLNKAAMKQYEEAYALAGNFFGSTDPKNKYSSNDYTTYAEVLLNVGKKEEHYAALVKAYEINPEKTDILKDISSAYADDKEYVKSAEYYQKYVDVVDESTNDLFVLAGKYQTVVATTTDSIAKADAFEKGIKYIDIVLERVPDDYRIMQRKARIEMVYDGVTSFKGGRALDSYKALLALLDKDPENITNHADAYMEIYNYLGGYALQNGNKEEAKAWYLKFLELDPNNTDLRNFIEKLK